MKGPVFSEISNFHGNVTIKGDSVFAGNKVLNESYDWDQSTSILWIGKNMNVKLSEATWNETYAPEKKDFILVVRARSWIDPNTACFVMLQVILMWQSRI
jgi:hypothetical protein